MYNAAGAKLEQFLLTSKSGAKNGSQLRQLRRCRRHVAAVPIDHGNKTPYHAARGFSDRWATGARALASRHGLLGLPDRLRPSVRVWTRDSA